MSYTDQAGVKERRTGSIVAIVAIAVIIAVIIAVTGAGPKLLEMASNAFLEKASP